MCMSWGKLWAVTKPTLYHCKTLYWPVNKPRLWLCYLLVSSCSTTKKKKNRLVVWLLTLPPWKSCWWKQWYVYQQIYHILQDVIPQRTCLTNWLQGGCWHLLTITRHMDSTCRNGHVCDTHCKPSLVYLLQPMNFPTYVCCISPC